MPSYNHQDIWHRASYSNELINTARQLATNESMCNIILVFTQDRGDLNMNSGFLSESSSLWSGSLVKEWRCLTLLYSSSILKKSVKRSQTGNRDFITTTELQATVALGQRALVVSFIKHDSLAVCPGSWTPSYLRWTAPRAPAGPRPSLSSAPRVWLLRLGCVLFSRWNQRKEV